MTILEECIRREVSLPTFGNFFPPQGVDEPTAPLSDTETVELFRIVQHLRDTENIPFTYEGGIDAFMQNEVLTYAPDAYVDEKKTQIGYEVSFTKYFYKPIEMRPMDEILESLKALDRDADGMMAEIMEGIE